VSGEPDYCKHIEAIIARTPGGDAIVTRRREAIRAAAKARKPQRSTNADPS
jgi:hypothetical protein